MQTGTGLGLAIVNSIMRSASVDGKVDVWSSENVGTEIKVTFTADAVDSKDLSSPLSELWSPREFAKPPTVTLIGFNGRHRGVQLLRKVLAGYLTSWWHLTILPEDSPIGNIVIVNEDSDPVVDALARKDIRRPFILLSSGRGDPVLMAIVNDYENIGGFCRILYKPGGPSRLHATLKLCLRSLIIGQHSKVIDAKSGEIRTPRAQKIISDDYGYMNGLTTPRRHHSDLGEKPESPASSPRPFIGTRSITIDPLLGPPPEIQQLPDIPESTSPKQGPSSPTIDIGTGGLLLKTSVGSVATPLRARILVVEDNHILRDLL